MHSDNRDIDTAEHEQELKELQNALSKRHIRRKGERRAMLNTIMGLSGGAIVLSATLIDKIAPKKSGHLADHCSLVFFRFGSTRGTLLLGGYDDAKYMLSKTYAVDRSGYYS